MTGTIGGLPDFWDTLRGRERRFLALDYDGTLAPFRVARMEATPLPGVVDAVERIAARGDTRIAVVSGRPIEDLRVLLDLPDRLGIAWVGSHGFEGQRRDGMRWTRELSEAQRRGLEQARAVAESLGHGDKLERKPSALAFHTRGLGPDVARGLQTTVASRWSLLCEGGLHLHAFDGGVELRVTTADKGQALRESLREEPSETFVVYVGDDVTDEDAFAVAVEAGGVGIRVGGGDRPTQAQGTLRDCGAVLEMLRRWADEPKMAEVRT
jgi:trehalose 6-phosphate phosphatase